MVNPYSTSVGMPKQRLPESQKDEDWVKECADAVRRYSITHSQGNRSTAESKAINYNLMNSYFNEEDFEYVLNPFNLPDGRDLKGPARLRNYNLLKPKVDLLLGEELGRAMDYRIVAVSGDDVSQRKEALKGATLEALRNMLKHEVQPEIDPTTGMPIPPEEPEQVKERFNKSYSTLAERTLNKVLEYVIRKEGAKRKFNEGWYDALVAGEEVYYVGVSNGDPFFRRVNPLHFDYDKNPNLRRIEDGQWAKEDRYMLPAEILDDYGEFLTEDQIDEIEQGLPGKSYPSGGMQPGYAYPEPLYSNSGRNNDTWNAGYIQVTTCVWKSMRKIGFLKIIDDDGEQYTELVDETFKLTPEMKEDGYEVDFQWISEVWKCTVIGSDIYVDYGPLPNQNRDAYDSSDCKLPFVGHTYNEVNSQSTSLIDLLRPYQYLFNVVWYRMELEIAKADGKKMLMDLAQLPKSQGIDMDRWIYYFKNVGLAFINSAEEGEEGRPPMAGNHAFNAFQSIDMTASQTIGQYIGILTKIEEMIDSLSGVSPQREGAINHNETATGVKNSIAQSHYITEHYFYQHNEVKKHVLEQLLGAARIAYIDGKEIQFVGDDGDVAFLEVDGATINLSEMGLFMTNDSEDNAIRDQIRNLAQMAAQNGTLAFSDLAEAFKAKSVSKIQDVIRTSERETQERQEQAQERQAQQQQQQIRMQQEAEAQKMQNENLNKQLDRETKIRVAMINAMDSTDVTQADILKQGEQALKAVESDKDYNLQQRKLEAEIRQKDEENRIKEKEIETELKIAKENKNRYDK